MQQEHQAVPLHHPWEASSPFSAGYSDSKNTGDALGSPITAFELL